MTNVPVRFRAATLHDVTSIVALVESAFRGESSRAGWTTEADLLDGQRTDAGKVADAITSPHSRILLAERDGALVASLLIKSEGHDAYLGMFAVQPRLQGAGLGKTLMAEAERIAREEMHAAGIRMTVVAQRPELIAWYECHGYRQTAEREPFPYGDERFGLPRRDDLYFVVLRKPLR